MKSFTSNFLHQISGQQACTLTPSQKQGSMETHAPSHQLPRLLPKHEGLKNSMQACFSHWQWCCSVNTKVVQAVLTSQCQHNFSPQMSFILYMPYLSAASTTTSWCPRRLAASHWKWSAARPWTPELTYHQSVCNPLWRCSHIAPKSSALKIEEYATRMYFCTRNVPPETLRTTNKNKCRGNKSFAN